MPLAQVALTPAESKRLIAKAVARLGEVQKALRSGTIVVTVGTTTGRVAEELLGKKIDLGRYAAGVILPKGTCVIPQEKRSESLVIRKGKITDAKESDVLPGLSTGDVFIKGANLLDSSGMAGVLLASRQGGTAGRVLGTLLSRGVNLVVPVGLEKFIPGSVREATITAGIDRVKSSVGAPVGIMPLPGKVVTELGAIRILTGGKATVIGKGGVSGAEGSVIISVAGTDKQLRVLKKLVDETKGEKPVKFETDCSTCSQEKCPSRGQK